MRLRHLISGVLVVAAGCIVGEVHAVMVIESFSTARHDRFADNSAYVGHGFNFSGVGRSSNSRWVTMLNDPHGGDPQYFVSAAHAQPSGTVTFHVDNNPTGTSISCTIDNAAPMAGMSIPSTDIWIGSVSGCDTSMITGYNIASTVSATPTVFQVGDNDTSGTAYDNIATDMRVGRNVLDFTLTETLLGHNAEWAVYADDSAAGDLTGGSNTGPNYLATNGTDETYYDSGDSGGPTFIDNSGTLELIGIHSFIGPLLMAGDGSLYFDTTDMSTDPEERRASGDAYLPASSAAIHAKITAVPEPSAFLYLAILACGCWIGKRLGGSR